jgi:hypothetical protein
MFLVWWTYAALGGNIKAPSEQHPDNASVHKRVMIVLEATFVVVLSAATTFGMQNGT